MTALSIDLIERAVQSELHELALEAKKHQEKLGLSDSKFIKQFRGLGSTKTYNKVLKQDWQQVNVEGWLDRYKDAVAMMDGDEPSDNSRDPIYTNLTSVILLKEALIEAMNKTGHDRVVMMFGDTGSGKTTAGKYLYERWDNNSVWVEASEVIGDKIGPFLGEVLKALGHRNPPISRVERYHKIITVLKRRKRTFFIDEAHHLGPSCFNVVKSLVNQTPGEFVLLAMPTLWRRMERKAWEEVRQLKGNRLSAKIDLGQLSHKDVEKFIRQMCPETNGFLTEAVLKIKDLCSEYGNLAFVKAVCIRAKELSAIDDEKIDPKIWSAAVKQEREARD